MGLVLIYDRYIAEIIEVFGEVTLPEGDISETDDRV